MGAADQRLNRSSSLARAVSAGEVVGGGVLLAPNKESSAFLASLVADSLRGVYALARGW